jgi:hypothetical protein
MKVEKGTGFLQLAYLTRRVTPIIAQDLFLSSGVKSPTTKSIVLL